MLYPAKDLIFFQADIHGNQLVKERVRTMRRLMEQKPLTIVTTYAALMTPLKLLGIHTPRQAHGALSLPHRLLQAVVIRQLPKG